MIVDNADYPRRFLRTRGGISEVATYRPQFSARQKSDALHVLRDVVVVVRHPYECDPASGAGNCWCARSEHNSLHDVVVEP